jgi:hypothetical protein
MVKKRKITSLSTTEKKTKISRNDRKEKIANDAFWTLKSVKCTLNPFCSNDRIKNAVKECVYWLSKLTVHSHHVMTLLLVHKKGDVTADYGMWNKVYRATLRALKGTSKETEEEDQIATSYMERCGVTPWPDGTMSGWMNKPLDEAARMSAVNYKTHLQTNLLIYVKRYIWLLVETDSRFQSINEASEKEKLAVFSCVCAAFCESLALEQIVRRRPSVQKLEIDDSVWTSATELVHTMSLVAPRGETTLNDISKCFYRLLTDLEPHAMSLQTRVLDSDQQQPTVRKRRKWTFALCPQHRWRPKHIRITNTGLQMMLHQLSKDSQDPQFTERYKRAVAEAGLHTDTWSKNFVFWNEFFRLDRVLRRKDIDHPSTKRMADSIMTDGVGVSVLIQVLKTQDEFRVCEMKNDLKKINADLKIAETDVLRAQKKTLETSIKDVQKTAAARKAKRVVDMVNDKCTVIALDPGKSNVGTWVVHDGGTVLRDDDEKYPHDTLFGGEWRFMSGQQQFTKKMNARTERHCPDITKQPSTKTASWSKLIESYKFQVDHGGAFDNAYFDSTLWYQKQKMRAFVKKQTALEIVARRVLGVKSKEMQRQVVVAYGDGDMTSNMHGLSPLLSTAFYKKIKSSATVQLVSEFRTSKVCSCCEHELTKVKNSFRVLCCDNSQCTRTFWNRDVNAAINILKLFLHTCVTGKRLDAFSRQRGVDE